MPLLHRNHKFTNIRIILTLEKALQCEKETSPNSTFLFIRGFRTTEWSLPSSTNKQYPQATNKILQQIPLFCT